MCLNLGVTAANKSLDPLTPVQNIYGDTYQWGRIVSAATTNDPATPEGPIVGWSTSSAGNAAWNLGTKAAPVKTANDAIQVFR